MANYVELSMVIEKQLGPEGMRQADAFFRRAVIDIEPVTVEQGTSWLRQAFLDFGKGRHKAGLNFGDPLGLRSRQGFRRTVAVQGQRFHRDGHPFGHNDTRPGMTGSKRPY